MKAVTPGRDDVVSHGRPVSRSLLVMGGALTATALVLTGCGDSDPKPAPASPAASTPAATTSAPAQVGVRTMKVARSAKDLGERVGKAVRRERTARVRLVNDGGAGAGTQSVGVIRFGEDLPAFTMSLDDPSRPMTMVAVPQGLFMRLTEPLDGKNWLKLTATLKDVEGDDAFSGIFAEVMDSTRSTIDINMIARTFRYATDFEPGDEESVNGMRATRYRLDLGEKALRRQLSQGMLDRAGGQLDGARGTVEVAVDAEWLPRQVVSRITVGGRTLTSTVTYTDWGRAEGVTAPPKGDVADVADYPDTKDIESKLQMAQ